MVYVLGEGAGEGDGAGVGVGEVEGEGEVGEGATPGLAGGVPGAGSVEGGGVGLVPVVVGSSVLACCLSDGVVAAGEAVLFFSDIT